MKMNQVSAVMDEAELEALIRKAVRNETGLIVDTVTFDIGTRCVGYGMAERDEPYFAGAKVTFVGGQDITAGVV